MKKGLRTYIMLSALLTVSGAIFASQPSSVAVQTTQAAQKKQATPNHTLADIGKEIIKDIEEVDEFIHNNIVPKIGGIVQEGETIITKEAPLISAVLKKVHINVTQQEEQNVINDVNEAVSMVSQGDAATNNLVQKLEQM
jgi:hypothetical protein